MKKWGLVEGLGHESEIIGPDGRHPLAGFVALRGHPLIFDFSFTNDLGTAPGTVTGEIVGLSDNATSAATALYIDSFPTSPFYVFGTGPFTLQLPGDTPFNVLSPLDQILDNSFTVSNGEIINANFSARIFASQGFLSNTLGLNSPANPLPYSYFSYDRFHYVSMETADDLAELAHICAVHARLETDPQAVRALWRLALDYQQRAAKLDSGVLPDIGDPPAHL